MSDARLDLSHDLRGGGGGIWSSTAAVRARLRSPNPEHIGFFNAGLPFGRGVRMMALTGVVFALAFIMVQFSAAPIRVAWYDCL
jgi:hypothetical protein